MNEFDGVTTITTVFNEDGSPDIRAAAVEVAEHAAEAWGTRDGADGVSITTALPNDVVVRVSLIQGRAGSYKTSRALVEGGEAETAGIVLGIEFLDDTAAILAAKEAAIPGMIRLLSSVMKAHEAD